MDAAQVAGFLVLLGVVGVLAAIVGSGIKAGPVAFPSIPGSRQKLLAVTSVAVVAGGVVWSLAQRDPGVTRAGAADVTLAKGGLRIFLVPRNANARTGEDIVVTSAVADRDGGLGPDQCVMSWQDTVDRTRVREDTTKCNGTFTEPGPLKVGVHRIAVAAEGLNGGVGDGTRTVNVSVSR